MKNKCLTAGLVFFAASFFWLIKGSLILAIVFAMIGLVFIALE